MATGKVPVLYVVLTFLFVSLFGFYWSCNFENSVNNPSRFQSPNSSPFIRILEHPDMITVVGSPLLEITPHKRQEDPCFRFLLRHQPVFSLPFKTHLLHIRSLKYAIPPYEPGIWERDTFFAPPPTTFTFKLKVPPDAVLVGAAGVVNKSFKRSRGGIGFIINARIPGKAQPFTLFQLGLRPGLYHHHRRWFPFEIDLSPFEGQEITLVFSTVFSKVKPAYPFLGAWANPVVIRRGIRTTRPNILLISLDTLRADRLSLYGHHHLTSPNIDRFARRGVVFENAISAAPFTLSSHMSIMTGRYPSFHYTNFIEKDHLPDSIPTLAEIFYQNGYRTVAFTGGGQLSNEYGFSRGFESYREFTLKEDDLPTKVEMALEWMENAGPGPFFMFLHTYKIHAPYRPKERFLRIFEKGYRGKINGEIKTIEMINKRKMSITQEDKDHLNALYDAEIREVDEALGSLFKRLETSGRLRNTIVIITSDHGEEFGEHGRWGIHSHTLYDELLRVPLIMVSPGHIPEGLRLNQLVSLVDLFPTLLELAGITNDIDHQGVSLINFWKSQTVPVRYRLVIAERLGKDGLTIRAVRSMNHKLIVTHLPDGTHRTEFYHLLEDPHEQNPTWAPWYTLNLFMERIRWLREGFLRKPHVSGRPVSPETMEILKTLGYIQ